MGIEWGELVSFDKDVGKMEPLGIDGKKKDLLWKVDFEMIPKYLNYLA